MHWERYKGALQRITALIGERRFDDALEQVDQLLDSSPNAVGLLIKRAMLIQLQDNENIGAPPLSEVRESLERAIEIEPNSIDAYVELGNFEHAVADDPKAALEHFKKAMTYSEDGLKAALIGMMKCQVEIGCPEDARSTLKRLQVLFPDDLDVAMMEDELID